MMLYYQKNDLIKNTLKLLNFYLKWLRSAQKLDLIVQRQRKSKMLQ